MCVIFYALYVLFIYAYVYIQLLLECVHMLNNHQYSSVYTSVYFISLIHKEFANYLR